METPNQNLEQLVGEAEEAIQKEDWPLVIKSCQRITQKFGKKAPADAWLWLTKAYLNEKMPEEAERTIAEGLAARPGKSKLLVLAGKIASGNQNWQLAKERWTQVLGILGEKAPAYAWAGLAKAQRLLGETEQAKETAEAGYEKYGQDPEILVELAEIAAVKKNWSVALNFWQAALKVINNQPEPNISAKKYARLNVSVLKRLVNLENYRLEIKKYAGSKNQRKIAIVTSYSKGYDILKPHEVLDDRFDYIVYTDEKIEGLGIFDVRPLPKPQLDSPRAIRYVKTHPHVLLPEYDIVVWIDASLMIVGDIYPLIKSFARSGLAVGSGVHPQRENIYEEFKANVERNKENYKIMKRQIDFYKKQGFEHSDLSENTLLMFNNKHAKLRPTLETWWQQIMRFSRRDQLSFNYSLAKNNTAWFRLTRPPHDIRNHPGFVMTDHHVTNTALNELIKAIKA